MSEYLSPISQHSISAGTGYFGFNKCISFICIGSFGAVEKCIRDNFLFDKLVGNILNAGALAFIVSLSRHLVAHDKASHNLA